MNRQSTPLDATDASAKPRATWRDLFALTPRSIAVLVAVVVAVTALCLRYVVTAPPHRVVIATPLNRYSIAFFYDPDPDALVAAIPSCVGEGGARYPPILAGEHLRMRLDASAPKDATKV